MSDMMPSESSQLPLANHMEVNWPTYTSQLTLSNDALQQCAAEHQGECNQQHANGNQILHVPHKTSFSSTQILYQIRVLHAKHYIS